MIFITCCIKNQQDHFISSHTPNNSEFSENIFKSINSKVILQVRNIFDSIISLVDHIDNEGVKFPSAFIDNESWFNFSRLEKIEFIIDMAIPWYISFYAGWFNSDIFKSGSVYLITYEKLVNNTSQEIKSILDWAGIKKNEGEIAQGLENTSKSNTRKKCWPIRSWIRNTSITERKGYQNGFLSF